MYYTLYLQIEDAEFAKAREEGGPEYYNFAYMKRDTENAGFDLLTAGTMPGRTLAGSTASLLDLGVRAMLINDSTKKPTHYWLLPRSSIFKTGFMMANSVGVIDSSYRGVLKAPVVQVANEAAGFNRGDRHFQIVAPDMGAITAVRRVDSLPETSRGDGGFGSTGR